MKHARILAVMLGLAITACSVQNGEVVSTATTPNQCLRMERFDKCMALLPAGPKSTVYNDWDEVVEACENAAYFQSLQPMNIIPPKCRP